MFHVPSQHITTHPFAADASGNNGAFKVPHHRIIDYYYWVIASDGGGWEHVSVSLTNKNKPVKRCCTWEEMCYIKDLFWDKEDYAVQFHPTQKDYVSTHEFCLHLWRPTNVNIELPHSAMVGLKTITNGQ